MDLNDYVENDAMNIKDKVKDNNNKENNISNYT